MAVKLSPESSGVIARAFDAAMEAQITDLKIEIAESLDYERCREDLLPFLAFNRGVDTWSPTWTVEQKRAVIRDAIPNFRKRGTKTGLIGELGNLASEVAIIEWWEEAGTPATGRVIVTGGSTLDSVEAQEAISIVVERARPYTRPMTVEVIILLDFPAVPRVGFRSLILQPIDSLFPMKRP